jgi:hypothetical protein
VKRSATHPNFGEADPRGLGPSPGKQIHALSTRFLLEDSGTKLLHVRRRCRGVTGQERRVYDVFMHIYKAETRCSIEIKRWFGSTSPCTIIARDTCIMSTENNNSIQGLFNRPITLTQFAEAIKELPADVLSAERHRLQNSVSHLERSNAELAKAAQETQDEDEQNIYNDAVKENQHVISQQHDRINAIVQRQVQLGLETPSDNSASTQNGVYL